MSRADNPCPVADRFRLSYLAFFDDAEKRAKRGQMQVFCGTCKRYCWPDHRKACPQFSEGVGPVVEGETGVSRDG